MTAERTRAPLRQGARTAGHALDRGVALADLFGLAPAAAPHPDFAARAAIWRDHGAGLISMAEAKRRSAAVGLEPPAPRAHDARVCAPARERPRHSRPAPNESRQYAAPMATTAARDDRLTPQAKALLQVLRARCGKGTTTTTTRHTLAAVMSRSARSIVRYLRDLEAFGYVRAEIHRNGRGLHLGLAVTILEKVAPFYEDAKGLARWLAETPAALFAPFTGRVLSGKAGVTKLDPINQPSQYSPLRKAVTGRRAARGRLLSRKGATGAEAI